MYDSSIYLKCMQMCTKAIQMIFTDPGNFLNDKIN